MIPPKPVFLQMGYATKILLGNVEVEKQLDVGDFFSLHFVSEIC